MTDSYKISLKPSVEKDLRGLPKNVLTKVISIIEKLSKEPLPPKTVKIEGTERTFRIRTGDYRVIYEIVKSEKTVIILYVRHRREIYRNF